MSYLHKVMNCIDFDEALFHGNGCASIKEDGVRGYYYPGESNLVSRQNKPLLGHDHIIEELRSQDTKHPIDIELTVPGCEFNEASGLIRSHSDTPESIANIIDVVMQESLRVRAAMRPLESDCIRHIPHIVVKNLPHFYRIYEDALADGKEGLVWKPLHRIYENKRGIWMRKVPISSEDCEVLDVYEGNGKMSGIAGGLIIDFAGLTCKCGTLKGFDYEARGELLTNKHRHIGRIAQVGYKNLQPSGKPRQPRFMRWRDDKC